MAVPKRIGRYEIPEELGHGAMGALPGLLGGTYLLRAVNARFSNPFVLAVIGVMLIGSAVLTAIHHRGRSQGNARRSHWIPFLSLPIGVETGFCSAGAGALGTLVLFNFSEMTAGEVVGTDLIFGIGLAFLGSLFHIGLGTIGLGILKSLLIGGVPGVMLGCILARRVPAQRLRYAILGLTMLLGFQLVFTAGKSIFSGSVAAQAVQTPRSSTSAVQ